MKQKTLDILDASLRDEQNEILTMDFKNRFGLFTRKNVRIDPKWSEAKFNEIDTTLLNWELPFKYSDRPNLDTIISEEHIGIYVMYVQPQNTILGMPKYVMNVGIAGEDGSERSLKDRLKDYYQLSSIKKRTNIHRFLSIYYENVYIVYSYFKGDHTELERIEKKLHEFFYPIFNIRDFEPETKNARKAWN
jgi:hypothetical protein